MSFGGAHPRVGGGDEAREGLCSDEIRRASVGEMREPEEQCWEQVREAEMPWRSQG